MRRASSVALLLLGVLSACALTPKFTPPRLSVVSVEIVSGDFWQQRLKVRMHVQNPNDRALPVRGLEYTLQVAGEEFASGNSAAAFVVPALGEADFDMNVTTNLAATLVKLLGHGSDSERSLDYRLTGKIALSEGLVRTIPFDERGTFTLQ
jgi:LEA14-like dessication related protein